MGLLACLMVGGIGMVDPVEAQGSLPDPPPGFTWESQGVMVYSDSGAFTVDLGQNDITGSESTATLDETISLSTYDATALLNEHVIVHSSTYSVSLDGLGSVVVINLDGTQETFSGTVGLNNWSVSGAGTAGPSSDGFANSNYVLDAASAGLFDDGGGPPKSSLAIVLADSGAAPTTGGIMDFDFDGTYDVNIGSTGAGGQWFASGTAHGDASIQTVYERFDLVAVMPEPSSLMMVMIGMAVCLRRFRR